MNNFILFRFNILISRTQIINIMNKLFYTLSFFCCFSMGLAQSNFGNDNTRINELLSLVSELDDHCEVPCGIYNDSVRIILMYEHANTIEKAMNKLGELSLAEAPNYNQVVRWVMNKESHAEEIQEIVSQYFLHQRIKMLNGDATKADSKKYFSQLENLHKISVYAMKVKQSTNERHVEKLKQAIHDFEHSYFGEH